MTYTSQSNSNTIFNGQTGDVLIHVFKDRSMFHIYVYTYA